jgi:hypothetical protein
MTNYEAFIKGVRDLCEKHGVEVSKMKAYYPGEPEDLEFYLKDDGKLISAEELFGEFHKGGN